jgi:hypothetical protein
MINIEKSIKEQNKEDVEAFKKHLELIKKLRDENRMKGEKG